MFRRDWVKVEPINDGGVTVAPRFKISYGHQRIAVGEKNVEDQITELIRDIYMSCGRKPEDYQP